MKSKAIVWFQKMKEACVIKSWDIFVMALQFFWYFDLRQPHRKSYQFKIDLFNEVYKNQFELLSK